MLKVAPTLLLEKIEPTLDFFVERLGFTTVAEVPGDEGLAFALLACDRFEVHLQTIAAAGKDIPYLGRAAFPPACFLYIDVDDVATLYEKLKGTEVLVGLEKTFYGATHFFIREPGGHVLGFSQNATHPATEL